MLKVSEGICLVWSHKRGAWRSNRNEYERRLSHAGHYTIADALMICTNAIGGTADRDGALPELPVRLCDVLAMLRTPDGAEYEPGGESWE